MVGTVLTMKLIAPAVTVRCGHISTDSHTGLATAEEENFFGKITAGEPGPERLTASFVSNPATGKKIMDWEVSSAG
jgi:hypothetical protein